MGALLRGQEGSGGNFEIFPWKQHLGFDKILVGPLAVYRFFRDEGLQNFVYLWDLLCFKVSHVLLQIFLLLWIFILLWMSPNNIRNPKQWSNSYMSSVCFYRKFIFFSTSPTFFRILKVWLMPLMLFFFPDSVPVMIFLLPYVPQRSVSRHLLGWPRYLWWPPWCILLGSWLRIWRPGRKNREQSFGRRR